MNKKSRKTKTLSLRLIALLLCCVCLVGAMPLVSATGEESSTVETGTTPSQQPTDPQEENQQPTDPQEENQQSTEPQGEGQQTTDPQGEGQQEGQGQQSTTQTADELYEWIMAELDKCTTGEEANDFLLTLTDEQNELMEEFSEEQNAALIKKMEELGLYGDEVTGGGGDIDPNYYNDTVAVYYDTVTVLGTGGSSAGDANISTVTLGGSGKTVTYGNANNTSWSGGFTLRTYFPNASQGETGMKDSTLSITAAEGYYVTGVVVACAPTGKQNSTPFDCSTWKNGNEFIRTFNLTNSTYTDGKYSLSFSINSRYFSHDGATSPKAYFILIHVAKVPTPLYVEYNYGDISAFKKDSNSAFSSPTWTVASSSNVYGSGDKYSSGVLTNATQFAYQYKEVAEINSWKHVANTISAEAEAEAAAKGYVFDGWSVTWYNNCTVRDQKDSVGNNKTMTFSDMYLEGTVAAGANVQLPTNVKLTAKWKKVPTQILTIQKTVSGNMADMTKAFAFTVTVNGTQSQFTLKANETKTINVQPGAKVIVAEEPDGYTNTIGSTTPSSLAYTVGEDKKSISFEMPNEAVTVVINNEKTATIDTGIGLDTFPYILILGLVACGGVLTLRKRRSQNAR